MIEIDGKQYTIQIGEKKYHCAVAVTMEMIGGKWKAVVLWYLRKKTKRFAELRRHIPDITEKMLTKQLRELERDGIVRRKVYAEVPPRVEYTLTEYGRTLLPLIEAIGEWGRARTKKFGKLVQVPGSRPPAAHKAAVIRLVHPRT
ncbi:MAG TPA: helix-turn-helix domain-containing protein [Bacteroidota bacterium]|jgi:DNA-binding HxlR family transcriptional regulator